MLATRGANAILGAVVGDAASLGTHWLYAREAIEAALQGPLGSGGEFTHPPIPAYHRARRAGQGSMYTEGLLCMARVLAASSTSAFSAPAFLQEWKASFGVCGSFSGYADGVTRATLYNMMRVAAESEGATHPPKGAPEALRGPLFQAIKAAAAELSGEALAARAAAIPGELGAPGQEAWAAGAAAAWERLLRAPVATGGADSSNTLGKLVPAAVAAAGAPDFEARLRAAIAVTQEAEEVAGYCLPLARAIEAAVLGTATTPRGAVEAALAHCQGERGQRLREALALADTGADTWAAAAKFGPSCAVASTAPMVVFVLARFGSLGLGEAVRHNMVGESCARACVIGAVLGALSGVPEEGWLARLDPALREETQALAATIAGRL